MQSYDYYGVLVPTDVADLDVDNINEPTGPVNHPTHYTSSGDIECIDACVSTYTNPIHATYVRNVIKYLWRAPLKGKYDEDIKKAKWYLDRLVSCLDRSVDPDAD